MTEQLNTDRQLGVAGEIRSGDAFDLVDELPDQSVNLVVTSPPYWGLRTYGHDHNEGILAEWVGRGMAASEIPPYDWYVKHGGVLGLEPYPDWYVRHLVEWFNRARRKLAPDGSLWVNLGDTYFARWASIREEGRQGLTDNRVRRKTPSGGYLHDKQLLLVPARFAIAMQDHGWVLRNDLIWAKQSPMPRSETDRLRLSHEHWFHFVQRSKVGRPQYYYDLSQTEELSLDVVSTPTSKGGAGHSATFPPEIIRPRITSSCPIGGLVLDPFCGSGTTVSEAVMLDRRSIGFELSETHAATAQSDVEVASSDQKRRPNQLRRVPKPA